MAIQGCGSVGSRLAGELAGAGARLVVADVDPAKVRRLVDELAATAVEPNAIHRHPADIFAPCALGGSLNSGTIPEIRAVIVAGAANNQLLEESDAERLEARGILYAPDYIANAGGVINGSREILGWTPERAAAKVEAIFDTTLGVLRQAALHKISPAQAADHLALQRLGLS